MNHFELNFRRIFPDTHALTDDICVKCLAKKLQVVDLQGVAA